MDALFIDPTQDTPLVILNKDTNTFIISHRSYPEDAFEFYKPVIEWCREYIKDANDNTIFDFKFDYFNTTSGKQIFKIMLILEKLSKEKSVIIRWHYRKTDKEIANHGEIFSKIINTKFEMIDF
jgi:hypothetical protein